MYVYKFAFACFFFFSFLLYVCCYLQLKTFNKEQKGTCAHTHIGGETEGEILKHIFSTITLAHCKKKNSWKKRCRTHTEVTKCDAAANKRARRNSRDGLKKKKKKEMPVQK